MRLSMARSLAAALVAVALAGVAHVTIRAEIIEQVIRMNDKPRAEVIVDVQILEVSRERAKRFGLNLTDYALGGIFSPEQAPGGSSTALVCSEISRPSTWRRRSWTGRPALMAGYQTRAGIVREPVVVTLARLSSRKPIGYGICAAAAPARIKIAGIRMVWRLA